MKLTKHLFTLALAIVLFSALSTVAHSSDEIFADGFDPPPVASFNFGTRGLAVTFTDQSIDDGGGAIASWQWDFGDGNASASQNPVHTYTSAGTYVVQETVVDGTNGETGVTSQSVNVMPCGTLTSYIYDFLAAGDAGGQPDFGNPTTGNFQGMVNTSITPRGVPTLNTSQPSGYGGVQSSSSFAQWFAEDPINYPIQQTLALADSSGTFSYSSNAYFPIDNEGFGNDGQAHNYLFTNVLHAQFQYNGGETFAFVGDDDVWVYINNLLAIDLGGVHGAEAGTITLDSPTATRLGMTLGQTYNLDLFRTQRFTGAGSDFTLSTTIQCLSDSH